MVDLNCDVKMILRLSKNALYEQGGCFDPAGQVLKNYPFHFIEQPMLGICSKGPWPV